MAYVAGTPPKALVDAFPPLNLETLSKAALRGNWPGPHRIKRAMNKRAREPQDAKEAPSGKTPKPAKPAEPDAFSLVQSLSDRQLLDMSHVSLARIGEINAMYTGKKYTCALLDTPAPAIRTMKDAHLAVQIVQSLTGRDKPMVGIAIGISGGMWRQADAEDIGEPA